MKCTAAKELFSPYLDGAVTGKQMLALDDHLQVCADCHQEYESLHHVQQLLGKIGRRKAPEDLSLKLRLAISREVASRKRPYFEGFRARLGNAVSAFMLPVTAGLVAAVLIFGLLTGVLASPLQAQYPDVPLMLYTAPQLQQSAFGTGLDAIQEDSLVIEAYVDSNGRVQDYRILSNPDEGKDLPSPVKNMLIFTTFRPATSMGRPTSGRAVLSFSKISVKG
ncbi:MAG: zf-HC2 domain-containing protein [Acidobacteriota bacterium]|nr:zf-HC2 domain-containing protein [Acidobacteriota bacterium]